MKVTYIQHSGFALEYEEDVLIFDYYRGKLPVFDKKKRIYVFASHAHPDHFRKKIFDWAGDYKQITYILSDEIKEEAPAGTTIHIGPGEERQVDELEIRALRSTDEGVAFLVSLKDKVIYHGGDMNWWHWEEEDPSYNEEMKRNYQSEIKRLDGMRIDVAFLPLDPRLKEQYLLGFDYFMRHTDTQCVFPMHMWNHYEVYRKLAEEEKAVGYLDKVREITRAGQEFEV